MKTKVVAKPSAVIGLIEAAHCGEGDWQDWSDRLLAAARPLLRLPQVTMAIMRRQVQNFEPIAGATAAPEVNAYWASRLSKVDAREFDALWRATNHVDVASLAMAGRELPEEVQRFYRAFGCSDALGLVAVVDDVSVVFGASHPSRIQLAAEDRKLLTQAVLHVEAGLRLRLYPGAGIAMLRPDGQLLHAEREATESGVSRTILARHVATVERGRGRKQRQAGSSVQAWSALISGDWGLVEREERGIGRYYAVVETSRLRRLRALTELETHAVELTARGLPGKTVGYALGVSSTRVSKLLASAAVKLGFGHRTRLVQVVAGLLASGPKLPDESALSKSERDVLSLVRMGFSNARIAEERQRSERTVANQVASILKKLDAPSRRALAVSRPARL